MHEDPAAAATGMSLTSRDRRVLEWLLDSESALAIRPTFGGVSAPSSSMPEIRNVAKDTPANQKRSGKSRLGALQRSVSEIASAMRSAPDHQGRGKSADGIHYGQGEVRWNTKRSIPRGCSEQ